LARRRQSELGRKTGAHFARIFSIDIGPKSRQRKRRDGIPASVMGK